MDLSTKSFFWILNAKQATVVTTLCQQVFLIVGLSINFFLWYNIEELFPSVDVENSLKQDFLLGIYANITIFTFKLLFGFLTVIGAILECRNYLLPWLIITPVSLFYLIFKAVSILSIANDIFSTFCFLIALVTLLGFLFYCFYAVFYLYQELNYSRKLTLSTPPKTIVRQAKIYSLASPTIQSKVINTYVP